MAKLKVKGIVEGTTLALFKENEWDDNRAKHIFYDSNCHDSVTIKLPNRIRTYRLVIHHLEYLHISMPVKVYPWTNIDIKANMRLDPQYIPIDPILDFHERFKGAVETFGEVLINKTIYKKL